MKLGPNQRTLLFGGGENLARLALWIKKQGRDVTVITSPRHASSRLEVNAVVLQDFLEIHKIPYLSVSDLNDKRVLDLISPSTLGLSLGAAWIFKKDFIDRFQGRLLNSHAARLPLDKGGGFHSWLILRDERASCFLVHQVNTGLDDGPIVHYEQFVYPTSLTTPAEYSRCYVEGNDRFLQTLVQDIESGKDFSLRSQVDYLGSYWPRLSTDKHAFIDWSWTREDIRRFICAFDEPFQGASTFLNGERLFLKGAFLISSEGLFHPFQQGILYRKAENFVCIACREGGLGIQSVKNENGKNVLSTLSLGDRFFTPLSHLEAAMQHRAIFTATGEKASTQDPNPLRSVSLGV
jgi:methionyl-tRNA formyltransferase